MSIDSTPPPITSYGYGSQVPVQEMSDAEIRQAAAQISANTGVAVDQLVMSMTAAKASGLEQFTVNVVTSAAGEPILALPTDFEYTISQLQLPDTFNSWSAVAFIAIYYMFMQEIATDQAMMKMVEAEIALSMIDMVSEMGKSSAEMIRQSAQQEATMYYAACATSVMTAAANLGQMGASAKLRSNSVKQRSEEQWAKDNPEVSTRLRNNQARRVDNEIELNGRPPQDGAEPPKRSEYPDGAEGDAQFDAAMSDYGCRVPPPKDQSEYPEGPEGQTQLENDQAAYDTANRLGNNGLEGKRREGTATGAEIQRCGDLESQNASLDEQIGRDAGLQNQYVENDVQRYNQAVAGFAQGMISIGQIQENLLKGALTVAKGDSDAMKAIFDTTSQILQQFLGMTTEARNQLRQDLSAVLQKMEAAANTVAQFGRPV